MNSMVYDLYASFEPNFVGQVFSHSNTASTLGFLYDSLTKKLRSSRASHFLKKKNHKRRPTNRRVEPRGLRLTSFVVNNPWLLGFKSALTNVICWRFTQAGTPNPTVTVWLQDLKNDSLSNVTTALERPQTLRDERWDR